MMRYKPEIMTEVSIRLHMRNADEQREFIDSVERGCYELGCHKNNYPN
jgi:hypothetical protein